MLTNCLAVCTHLTITVSQTEPDIGRKSSFFSFILPLHSTPPLGGSPSEYRHPVWYGITRMAWLPDGEKCRRYVYSFWHVPWTWQTDRRTPDDGIGRAYASHRAAKTNKKPHPSFGMVPVWMSSSDLFKVMIIQCQITWKWPTNRNLDLSNGAIFNDLKNGMTYRHSVIEIVIGTYTHSKQQCHFEWPWVTSSDLAKYSMTRSLARSLCDSWASCVISGSVET